MAASKTTTNHDEIKRWVEKNGGCPARVKATGRSKGDPGILRIDYPGFSGQSTLAKMGWDEWFEAFDANKLAFVYQPSTRFSKLIARSAAPRRTATAGRTSAQARGRGAKKAAARTPKRTTARRAPKQTAKRSTSRATSKTTSRTAKRTTKRPAKRARSTAKRARSTA